jgi:hypothetical protein
MGIDNLRMRAQRIGAQIFWQNTEDEQGCSGSLLRLQLPVAAMRAAAPAAMNSPSKTLTPD